MLEISSTSRKDIYYYASEGVLGSRLMPGYNIDNWAILMMHLAMLLPAITCTMHALTTVAAAISTTTTSTIALRMRLCMHIIGLCLGLNISIMNQVIVG